MSQTKKRYSELIRIPSYEERLEYLKLGAGVGEDTFGFDRYLNQDFYRSPEWRRFRNSIILRDTNFLIGFDANYCCDLGHPEHPIPDGVAIIIHHINPITKEDILNSAPCILDPENAISTVLPTHNIIHYGGAVIQTPVLVERRPNDTCPWRN